MSIQQSSNDTSYDPWHVVWKDDAKWKWKDINNKQKVFQVFCGIMEVGILLGLLYVFILSLGLLGSAFQILGGTSAGLTFSNSEVFNNPIAGLVIGILATVLVQSSSTSTSIIISMTAAGLLKVDQAIYMIMGANIGTSITNTIVSLGQFNDVDEFRRGFAAATVHDMFNWLSVFILLPVEAITGMLQAMAESAVKTLDVEVDPDYESPNFLKKLTKPATSKIISVNKDLIKEIGKATNETEQQMIIDSSSMIKWKNCDKIEKKFLYCSNESWSDSAVGITLLIWSLAMLCICLILIVKFLQFVLKGSVANHLHKWLNVVFPDPWTWVSDWVLLIVGVGYTILMQSSSITTSSLTPLCGLGLLRLEKMFPVTVGANVGTTFTGILAAMGSDDLNIALTVAFTHLFFNLWGIIIWFLIPKMRTIPVQLAKKMGNVTAQYRWFPGVYIMFAFVIAPAILLALGTAGWEVMFGVLFPICIIGIALAIIFYLRKKKPGFLPDYLQEFYWFPDWCADTLNAFHAKQVAKAQKREKDKQASEDTEPRITFLDKCYMILADNKDARATIAV